MGHCLRTDLEEPTEGEQWFEFRFETFAVGWKITGASRPAVPKTLPADFWLTMVFYPSA